MHHVKRLFAIVNLLSSIAFILVMKIPVHKWSLYADIGKADAPITFSVAFLAWLAFLLIASIQTMITARKNIFTFLSFASWIIILVIQATNKTCSQTVPLTLVQQSIGYIQISGTTILTVIILLIDEQKRCAS